MFLEEYEETPYKVMQWAGVRKNGETYVMLGAWSDNTEIERNYWAVRYLEDTNDAFQELLLKPVCVCIKHVYEMRYLKVLPYTCTRAVGDVLQIASIFSLKKYKLTFLL